MTTNYAPQEPNGKVTIADIAKSVGVSSATVSLVLRNKPGIGEETRQRVLNSAARLGYAVNPPAGGARSVINTIGVVVKERPGELSTDNPFYSRVLAGIDAYCRQQDINLMYANLPVDDQDRPLGPPRILRERVADGLLIVGLDLSDATEQMVARQGGPVVLVDSFSNHALFDAVQSDNVHGGFLATSHLIAQGHRHIAVAGSTPDAYPSILGRRHGYEQAIAEAGLNAHHIDCAYYLADDVISTTTDYLRAHPEISAIVGCNDSVAMLASQAAQEMGKRIPDDISIIGYDDINAARMVIPALTTMRVDKLRMGRMASQMLVERIEQPDSGRVVAYVQPELVERASVQRHANLAEMNEERS